MMVIEPGDRFVVKESGIVWQIRGHEERQLSEGGHRYPGRFVPRTIEFDERPISTPDAIGYLRVLGYDPQVREEKPSKPPKVVEVQDGDKFCMFLTGNMCQQREQKSRTIGFVAASDWYPGGFLLALNEEHYLTTDKALARLRSWGYTIDDQRKPKEVLPEAVKIEGQGRANGYKNGCDAKGMAHEFERTPGDTWRLKCRKCGLYDIEKIPEAVDCSWCVWHKERKVARCPFGTKEVVEKEVAWLNEHQGNVFEARPVRKWI